jgi:hypothetical protein
MTDVKSLLDKWRADADSRQTYDQAVVKTLRYCADGLEALLALPADLRASNVLGDMDSVGPLTIALGRPADLPPTEAPVDVVIERALNCAEMTRKEADAAGLSMLSWRIFVMDLEQQLFAPALPPPVEPDVEQAIEDIRQSLDWLCDHANGHQVAPRKDIAVQRAMAVHALNRLRRYARATPPAPQDK